jgi:hypothetical protein
MVQIGQVTAAFTQPVYRLDEPSPGMSRRWSGAHANVETTRGDTELNSVGR